MLLGDGNEVLGGVAPEAMGSIRVAQPGGEHPGGDAGVVHGFEQALHGRALGEVVAEELAHALVLLLSHPLGGEGLRKEVHPGIDDHAADST